MELCYSENFQQKEIDKMDFFEKSADGNADFEIPYYLKESIITILSENNIYINSFDFKEVLVKNIFIDITNDVSLIFRKIGKRVKWLEVQDSYMSKRNLIEMLKLMPSLKTLTITDCNINNSLDYLEDEKVKWKPQRVDGFVASTKSYEFRFIYDKYYFNLESSSTIKLYTV